MLSLQIMDFGINTIKDIAELLSYIVASVSLGGIFYSYIFSKKQIHFSTMEKCTTDFRNIVSKQTTTNNEDLAWQYIDLVNEEFFYLEQNYLPMTICIEWIDGMIDYLPFYNNGELEDSSKLSMLNESAFLDEMIKDYPRVKKAITLKTNINFNYVKIFPSNEEENTLRFAERNTLIYTIISNLKISKWRKFRLKQKISKR